jgi:two-component system nitrate/nitrite response regulator NarL
MRKPDPVIRMLLADDHPLVREGLRSCLSAAPGIEIVGEAADGCEAMQRVRTLAPDVVLLDLNMPRMSGLEAATAILREHPHVRVLVLSVHHQLEYSVEIILSGAHGHVSKDAAPAELIRAIETVARGGTHFEVAATVQYLRRYAPAAPCAMIPAHKALTPRETDVLALVAEGLGNREIAARLALGLRTVETHREHLMRKLDIHTVAGLTRYAMARGLVARGPN